VIIGRFDLSEHGTTRECNRKPESCHGRCQHKLVAKHWIFNLVTTERKKMSAIYIYTGCRGMCGVHHSEQDTNAPMLLGWYLEEATTCTRKGQTDRVNEQIYPPALEMKRKSRDDSEDNQLFIQHTCVLNLSHLVKWWDFLDFSCFSISLPLTWPTLQCSLALCHVPQFKSWPQLCIKV
jgi:hypothetical protein